MGATATTAITVVKPSTTVKAKAVKSGITIKPVTVEDQQTKELKKLKTQLSNIRAAVRGRWQTAQDELKEARLQLASARARVTLLEAKTDSLDSLVRYY